jgi:hypothetical protein
LSLWSKEELAGASEGPVVFPPSTAGEERAGSVATRPAAEPALSKDHDAVTIALIDQMKPAAVAEALRRHGAPDTAFGTPYQMRKALKEILELEAPFEEVH